MSVATIQNVTIVSTWTVKATADTDAGKPITPAGGIAGADAHILGIASQTVLNGEDLSVITQGQAEVIAGGLITAGDYVKVGTGGKFLSADAAAFAAGKVVGKAITGASADGDKFTFMIIC